VYRPRPELQKAAPRNFDAFFEPVYFEKQKKTVEIPSVRARLFSGFLKRAFCNSRLQQGDPSFACRNQAAETKGVHAMTQTAQHTPGPWNYSRRADGNYNLLGYGDDKLNLAVIKYFNLLNEREKESEANARLIAAAPDMLAALQSIVEIVDPYSLDKEGREARAKALHAIWKALPRQATNRPGDEAAAMHEETGIDYERCLIMCNMD
jgi:hypothetical protein